MTTTPSSYQSLTTENFSHDPSNFLTEILLVLNNPNVPDFPWRKEYKVFWGKNLSLIKKLQNSPFNISIEQLCWYIINNAPKELSSKDFAKAAYMCRKLFKKMDLSTARTLVLQKIRLNDSVINIPSAKITKKRTLEEFLKDIENG